MNTTLTCFIIGQDNLHLQCAKILKEKHHTILGIISLLEASREWAYEQDIPHYFTLEDARAVLSSTEFDYLFSIVNSHILSEDLLARPRHAAINFHDALLPRYAGVNATNWAILNQEKTHGVTWHIATREVDAGDILKQKAVTIEADETAFNLNLKCYEAALELFPELVDELANQTVQRIAQDPAQRTYVGYTHKPEGNGWINWHDTAESIMRTFRALQMGEGYPNPLATAKFTVQDHAFIIQGMSMTENSSHQSPGTVVSCDESGLQIATSTLDIHITAIKTQLGKSVDWKAFQTRYIQAGTVLASPSQEDSATFQTLSQTYMRHESYWVRSWQAFDPMQIPFLSQKIHTQDGYHYACVSQLPLSDSLRQALKNLLSAEQDFWTLLLTVWSVYLYRVSNYQNFGFLLSRDSDAALHPNLACFLNATIPFRVGLEENQTILEAYACVKRALDERQDRAGYLRDIFARYPSLSEVNQPPMLTVLSATKAEIETSLAGLQADCALVIDPSGDHLSWHFAREYVEADEYLRPILENFAGHLLTMLTAISQNPETALKDLPILTAAEEHKLLVEWNDTATDYPKDKTIHQLFEEQVEKTPDNVAVCFEDQSLTYRELNEKANQLAHYLFQGKNNLKKPIGFYAERSINMIITILGILKSGSFYVPIDPDNPLKKIQSIIEDCKIESVIVWKMSQKFLKLKNISIINIEDIFLKNINTKNNNSYNTSSKNIAYVIYTSGSTGKPKGVEATHQAVVRLVKNTNYTQINQHDSLAHLSNPAFDASTFELWGALLNGAKLVILKKDRISNLNFFKNDLEDYKISKLFITTALFSYIISEDHNFFKNLDQIFFGGEAVSKDIIENIKKIEKENMIHVYGPTENTTFTLFYEIKNLNFHKNNIPVGTPISNTTVYLLDKNKKPIPIGFSGELYIGGDGLSPGYRNNSDATNSVFLNDIKFCNQISRLYKSGDLLRWLPNGKLEFLTRADEQIKIRGFRVELSEIENALMQQNFFSKVKVFYINREISAFLIKKTPVNLPKIKFYLKKTIPSYMIPKKFYEIKSFTLNRNGKIDLKKIIQSSKRIIDTEKNIKNINLSEKQKKYLEIFKKTFDFEVGLDDNFFDIGGDSIIAMQICGKAKKYGINISVKDILSLQTIRLFSTKNSQIYEKEIKSKNKPSCSFPLNPIQKWFFEKNMFEKNFFSQCCLIEIPYFYYKKIKKTLKSLINNFDIFRQFFSYNSSEWFQSYLRLNQNNFCFIETIEFSKNELFEENVKKIIFETQSCFELEKGRIFKFYLIKTGGENFYFLGIIHHLLIDGISWRIFLESLNDLLVDNKCFLEKTQSHLREFVYEQIDYSKNLKLEDFEFFKRDNTNEFCSFLLDYPDGENIEDSVCCLEKTFSKKETTFLISHVLKKIDFRINEFLLSLLFVSIFDCLKTKKMQIDVESHGRSDLFLTDLSSELGWFTSLFPLKIEHDSSKNLMENIFIIKNKIRSILNLGVDYGILKYIKKESDLLESSPISFNYWGNFDFIFSKKSKIKFKWLKLYSHPKNNRTHLINFESIIQNGELKIFYFYSKNIHKKETIERISNKFNECFFSITKEHESINKKINEKKYQLTPMQKGILFESSFHKGSYIIQVFWKSKEYDISLFVSALEILTRSNEILRTKFLLDSENFFSYQIVQNKVEIPLKIYSWKSFDVYDYKNKLLNFLNADRESGFSIDQAPLFRVSVIEDSFEKKLTILTFHHVILDGWSLSVFLNKLDSIYEELKYKNKIKNKTSANYSEYALWVNSISSSVIKKSEIFWKEYLNFKDSDYGSLKSCLLINDKKDDFTDNYFDFIEKTVHLSEFESMKIKQFLTINRITLGAFIYGIWGILIHRYTQNSDVIFAHTISLRPSQIENSNEILGLMVNTLPFYLSSNDFKQSFLDYFLNVQKILFEIIEHGYISLKNLKTRENKKIFFETLLVFENYPSLNMKNLCENSEEIKIIDQTHYDLTLSVFSKDKIYFKFSFNKKVDEKILIFFINDMLFLCSNFFENLEKMANSLSFSSTKYFYDKKNEELNCEKKSMSIKSLFEKQVESNPYDIAIVFGDISLTYSELNKKSNQLAMFLKRKGATPESKIMIFMDRSINLIISILAVLKTGSAYVPIDISYPKERIEFILNDSQSKFIIVEFANEFEDQIIKNYFDIFVVDLEKEQKNINFESDKNLVDVDSDSLAYVIYTSGSTGKPKGVLIENKQVTDLFYNSRNLFDFKKNDSWSLFHSFCFDFSVWEIFGCFFSGGILHLVSGKDQKNLESFYDFLFDKKISILNITPGVFYKLIHIDKKIRKKLNLNYVIFGGESLSFHLLSDWFLLHGYENPKLVNMYGITETTIHNTFLIVDQEILNLYPSKSIIGKPLPGRRIFFLDNNKIPAPVNVPGEIFVEGGHARGYLNQKSLTSERFLDITIDGELHRLYRSGDAGRMLIDGNIEYLGRLDNQVKIRGFRIELGEIESIIDSHPFVKKSVVTCLKKNDYDKILVAYFETIENVLIKISDIKVHLSDKLPRHMVPCYFIQIENFPLTENGKLNKKLLPLPDLEGVFEKKYLPPSSQIQNKLVFIWSKLLCRNFETLSIEDDFFELGGDSFSVIDMLNLVRSEFNIDITFKDFLENQNILKFSELIKKTILDNAIFNRCLTKNKNGLNNCLIPLKPNGNRPPLFLVHPIGGTVFWYISLVKYFHPDQPLYAIQDPGIEMDRVPFLTVSEMANFYITIIQKIQPSGSYYIGGASAGATISIEMASQLEKKGEEVCFIALLDGWAPFPDELRNQAFFEANMRRQYNKMHGKFLAKGIKMAESLLALQWARSQMIADYKLPFITQKLTLFKSLETMSVFQSIDDKFNHWENYSLYPIELHMVPGNHETMFDEPHVEQLAVSIIECLDKAQKKHIFESLETKVN